MPYRCKTPTFETANTYPATAQKRLSELAKAASKASLKELRSFWRYQFGRQAPVNLSRGLLYRFLLYRAQVEEFGDIPPQIARQLDQIGTDREFAIPNPAQNGLRLGNILIREYSNARHEVTVTQSGFLWEGKEFRSLSAVAHAITGTKWNGRRFFGLQAKN